VPAIPSVLPSTDVTVLARTGRIDSIDIFRGLTIAVMIFVNDLAGVRGLPWWTYHMPGDVNGMTYVDVVFPAFLFILGMSIPLALERRLARGESRLKVSRHVALRSVGLLTLGIFLANSSKLSPALSGIGTVAWHLVGFAGVFLFWNVYPRSESRRRLYRGLRSLGLLLVIAALALFRRQTNSGPAWLDFSYWEILGLIGWAYLAIAFLYLLLRRVRWGCAAALAGLCLLNVLSIVRPAMLAGQWRRFWPFEAGLCSIAMAGVVGSIHVFGTNGDGTRRTRLFWAVGYGTLLLAVGWALSPLGISKIHDTPAWCLLCSGISMLLFSAVYWLADVRGRTGWAAFVKPAGSNTLLTYLLPDVWYAIPVLAAAFAPWYAGGAGVIRALGFTGLMLAVSALLTRLGVRLQL
jgi:heparan-alpha-glucosaminide N-acetyltransferase